MRLKSGNATHGATVNTGNNSATTENDLLHGQLTGSPIGNAKLSISKTTPTAPSLVITGTSSNDTLIGSADDDQMDGGSGNDTLYGRAGNDAMSGGPGNDVLHGEAGDDLLLGNDGVDTLNGGDGNDVLDGGIGNDILNGGVGENRYLFGRGDGQDIIQAVSDNISNKANILELKVGVNPGDVLLRQVGDNGATGFNALEVSILGTADKIIINSFFSSENPLNINNPVQYIAFNDGITFWDINEMVARAFPGTAAVDSYIGTITDNIINGLGGNDNLYGRAGNDTINGGLNDDKLFGETGDDTLSGDGGNDALSGGDGTDILFGGDGADTLNGDVGDDTLDGNAGNDNFTGGVGNNIYMFGRGDGQDIIQAFTDATAGKVNTLQLKPGISPTEVLLRQVGASGGAGNTALEISIIGTADKITINSFFHTENPLNTQNPIQQLAFNDGTVWDINELTVRAFLGTSAAETIIGTADANVINGLAGNDTLYGRAGEDSITGGLGNDSLYGEMGNDTLQGDDGVDVLNGGAGDDVLNGGTGNDTLNGDVGNNVYWFGRGDGQDIIQAFTDATVDKSNIVQLKPGISPSEVLIRQVADGQLGVANGALELSIIGTTDKITINGFFHTENPLNTRNPIQAIFFNDGTGWDINELVRRAHLGTDAVDTIVGSADANTINGFGGNDILWGRAGDDTIQGGLGNDTLYGEADADLLQGNDGVDTLNGGDGNDVLDGGTGNDILNGGVGENRYLFGRGDGQDIIQAVSDNISNKANVLELKVGVNPSDVLIRQVGDNGTTGTNALEVSILGSTDKITINSFFSAENPLNISNPVQYVVFNDGITAWDINELVARAFPGTTAADTYVGTAGENVINGLGGNDVLSGRAGNDTINAGLNDDKLYGETGDDTLFGDGGNDTLSGGDGADVLYGGDGVDTLTGDVGDDTLDGNGGNDSLTGGVGNNIYMFGRGDGQDVIQAFTDATSGKVNTLWLKPGISPTEVLLRQVGASGGTGNTALEISIIGTTDKITINSFFHTENPLNTQNPIQQLAFNDGTVWDINELTVRAFVGTSAAETIIGTADANEINGLAGNDTLYGRAGEDSITGGLGNDSLYGEMGNDTLQGDDGVDVLNGGAGDDVLNGGTGNDTLNGDVGNNVYLFGRGDGQDTIQWFTDATAGKNNIVQLKPGISPSEVLIRQVADGQLGVANGALELSIIGTTDKITINGFFHTENPLNTRNPIQAIFFNDGTGWGINELVTLAHLGTAAADTIVGSADANTINGFGGNDVLWGRAADDTIQGGLGNDTVYGETGADLLQGDDGADTLNGGDGNDVLDGGTGNDILNGGTGENRYLFGRGDAQDIIQAFSDSSSNKSNVLELKVGVNPSDVLLRQVGDNGTVGTTALEVSIPGSTDKITINAFFSAENPLNISNPVQYIAFNDGITVWDINEMVARAFPGTTAADTYIGTAADNIINGLGGNDVLHGRAGNDTINGGLNEDRIYGEIGDDTLLGDGGNDTMSGGDGADILLGGDGVDALIGDAGDDTLDGNAGNDSLNGGVGNNTYLFGRGDGQDIILAFTDATYGKVNTLQLKPGISPTDVSLRQVGASGGIGNTALEISIIGSTDKIVINSFFYAENPLNTQNPVQQLVFNDGTGWDINELTVRAFLGTSAADTTIGTADANVINGLVGNDILYGRAGDDTITGGLNNDSLYGEAGNDTLQGDDGVDILNGGTGDDVLNGGTGNDTLDGGTGNNWYVFGQGHGQDLIRAVADSTAGKLNTLHFNAGINPNNVILKRVYDGQLGGTNALEVTFAGNTDRVVINGFYYANNPGNANNPIQQFYFDNGEVWDLATIVSHQVGLTGISANQPELLF